MRTKVSAQKVAPGLAEQSRIAIIRAEFNSEITASLEGSCSAALAAAGFPGPRVDRFTVPGCFEIPIMAQSLAGLQKYDLIIAFGCVIRGDTYHFELVANECARGIMDVSLKHDIPIVFEVLAVNRLKDARSRAGNNAMNKGIEAAATALSMLEKLDSLT